MVNPNNQHKNPISHFTTKHTKYSIKVLRLVVVGLIIIKSFILLEYNMIPDITGMCIFFTLFLAAITAIFRYIFFGEVRTKLLEQSLMRFFVPL